MIPCLTNGIELAPLALTCCIASFSKRLPRTNRVHTLRASLSSLAEGSIYMLSLELQ